MKHPLNGRVGLVWFCCLLPLLAPRLCVAGPTFSFEKIEDAGGAYDKFTFPQFFPDGQTMLFRATTSEWGFYDMATRTVTRTLSFESIPFSSGAPAMGSDALLFGLTGGGLGTFDPVSGDRIFAVSSEAVGGGTLIKGGIAGTRMGYGVRSGDADGIYADNDLIVPPTLADPSDGNLMVGPPGKIGFTPLQLYFIPATPSTLQGDRIFQANPDGTGLRRLVDLDMTPPGEADHIKYAGFFQLVAVGNNAVFRASIGIGLSGIYFSDGINPIQTIATSITDLPQGGGRFSRFDVWSPGFWIDGDDVLFVARDSNSDIGTYLWREGQLSKVATRGDMVDGMYVTGARFRQYAFAGGNMILELRLSDDPEAPDAGPVTPYFVNASGSGGPTPTPTPTQPSAPDLAVQINPVDNPLITTEVPTDLVCGNSGLFEVTVSNLGTGPTTAPITVVVDLPEGLTFGSGGGQDTGWVCTAEGQTVTCVRTDPLGTSNPFTTAFLVGTAVSEAVGSSAEVNVSVSTVGDSDPSNNSGVVIATVGEPPVKIVIVSPEEGAAVAGGSRHRISMKILGPNLDYHLQASSLTWDGGPTFQDSEGAPFPATIRSVSRYSESLPEVPFNLPDNHPIVFGFRLIDAFGIATKPGTVTVHAKKVPGPPVIKLLGVGDTQGDVIGLDESGRIEIIALVSIHADRGLRDGFSFQLNGGVVNDPGLISYDYAPYVAGRGSEGHITDLNLFLRASFRGEDYVQIFSSGDPRVVYLDVAATDLTGVETQALFNFAIKNEPDGPPEVIIVSKGTNSIDDKTRVKDSLITGSTLEESVILGATIENSVIRSSVILPGVHATGAEIDLGVVLSGTVARDGATLSPPALLAELYEAGTSGHVLSTVLTGDANEDGEVSPEDRLAIAREWRDLSEAFDLDLDGKLGVQDLIDLIGFWRENAGISD